DEETAIFRNADPRLKYLGKVSAQEKADALAACDVFCMPSMSEILPTVYLEAWTYGRPVVGGRAHGLPELVEGNKAGFAVSQDGNDVAAALLRLLNDSELRERLGAAGKNLVAEKYAVDAVTGQLEALYKNLVAVRHPNKRTALSG
ncbi:MAG: glycosyltransferase family 4 protein, partial [bacterium]